MQNSGMDYELGGEIGELWKNVGIKSESSNKCINSLIHDKERAR